MNFIFNEKEGAIEWIEYSYLDVGFELDITCNTKSKLKEKYKNHDKYFGDDDLANELTKTELLNDFNNVYNNLSNNAKNIINIIIDNIRFNGSWFILREQELANHFNKSKQTIHKAVKELENNNIIRQARKYCKPRCTNRKNYIKELYIINHNYIFRGRYATLYYEIFKQRNIENDFSDFDAYF